MVPSIRILLAEDSLEDRALELRELKRAGLRVEAQFAITADDFIRDLREFSPDVIVSDFSMPTFDGMEALRLAREHAPDVPFIFVSGTIGEEYAIRALKNGATDYVLKENLARLPAAIERAVEGVGERRARRLAEAGLRRAQLMAKLAHIVTGPGGVFEAWSESLPTLTGIAAVRSTREWLEQVHAEDRDAFRAASLRAAESGRRVDLEYRLRRGDGAWVHIRQAIEPLEAHVDGPHGGRWFSTLQDITEQKASSEAVRRLNRVYAVLSGINNLIARTGDTATLYGEACGIAVRQGQFPLAWIGLVDPEGSRVDVVASSGAGEGYLERMPMSLNDGMAGDAVRSGRAQVANDIAGDPRVITKAAALARGFRSLAVLPLHLAGKVAGVMTLYADQAGFFDEEEMRLLEGLAGDISFAMEHIRKGERLEFVSNYDTVTGLANRTLFIDRLGQALAATAPGRLCALVVLDIERFKTINDSLGRAAGDDLLARMAERLVDLTTDVGRVARTGPDQFAVMIPGVGAIERVARAIDEGFRHVEDAPFNVGGTSLRVAVRCGIAVHPADGQDADALFRNAEAALKKAKQGGEKYLFYTQRMTERVAERLSLENRLRIALEKEEFVLHYQPKVRVADRRIVGMEALIRWQSPNGMVPPVQFIGLLEETGLIGPVGAWALRRAALDHRAWRAAGLEAPRVAVNVSALQLRQAGFVATVQEALGASPSKAGVDLEITESVVMEDIDATIGKLRALRELGLDLAIDDFGTGYSSLAYLARLPVHALKIDRSFVAGMEADPNAMTLVATIISLAHSLRLQVVAEGVETESQAGILARLGCDQMQGYLISKPVPAEAIAALLR